MGMILLAALALAARPAAAPADGHTVVPLAKATLATELLCDGPLRNAFLTPAASGLGVRAPGLASKVRCTLIGPKGAKSKVELKFEPAGKLVLDAARSPVLGQDAQAVLEVKGGAPGLRAVGSAGAATLSGSKVSAALPAKHMPQYLVVLVASSTGEAAYAVVPLLGRAKVAVKTKPRAKLEVVVAGHRTTGFLADRKGKAELSVPAPPGFAGGELYVKDKHRKTESEIALPRAKDLYALAALGPAEAVTSGATVLVFVAGSNPQGLPPGEGELAATAGGGASIAGKKLMAPGLWRLEVTAPASGQGSVDLALGNAKAKVAFDVRPGAAPAQEGAISLEVEQDRQEMSPRAPTLKLSVQALDRLGKPARDPVKVAVRGPARFTPSRQVPGRVEGTLSLEPGAKLPDLISVHLEAGSSARDLVIAAEAGPGAEVAARPAPMAPAPAPAKIEVVAAQGEGNGSRVHLGALLEAGYLTNGGAIAGAAPGLGVQLTYRVGHLDIGLGADALVSQTRQTASLSVDGARLGTTTVTQTLQAIGGPWLRLGLTHVVGLAVGGGAGIARVWQTVSANDQVNASALGSGLAWGGIAGLDLDFGLARAFAGARYVTAQPSSGLAGPSGGIAGLAGVGIDLGL